MQDYTQPKEEQLTNFIFSYLKQKDSRSAYMENTLKEKKLNFAHLYNRTT